jgi:hypothetical protein
LTAKLSGFLDRYFTLMGFSLLGKIKFAQILMFPPGCFPVWFLPSSHLLCHLSDTGNVWGTAQSPFSYLPPQTTHDFDLNEIYTYQCWADYQLRKRLDKMSKVKIRGSTGFVWNTQIRWFSSSPHGLHAISTMIRQCLCKSTKQNHFSLILRSMVASIAAKWKPAFGQTQDP